MERQTGNHGESQLNEREGPGELEPARRAWTVIGGLLEAQGGHVEESKTPGELSHGGLPQYCETCLQELDKIPTVNVKGRSLGFQQRKGAKGPL